MFIWNTITSYINIHSPFVLPLIIMSSLLLGMVILIWTYYYYYSKYLHILVVEWLMDHSLYYILQRMLLCVFKSKEMSAVCNTTEEVWKSLVISIGKKKIGGTGRLGRLWRRVEECIKVYATHIKGIEYYTVVWVHPFLDRDKEWTVVNKWNEFRDPWKYRKFLGNWPTLRYWKTRHEWYLCCS